MAEYTALEQRLQAIITQQAQTIEELRTSLAQYEVSDGEDDAVEDEDEGEEVGERRAEGGRWGAVPTADRLRQRIGVGANRMVPACDFRGDPHRPTALKNWAKQSIRHIAAVIVDRPMDHIILALQRHSEKHPHGRLRELADHAQFVSQVKRIIQLALAGITEHWSARLSVHLWDRLELSRDRMEMLRHLLSFTYNSASDKYNPIPVWTNPWKKDDVISAPAIVGRFGR